MTLGASMSDAAAVPLGDALRPTAGLRRATTRRPKPVAITVTRTSSFSDSSMTAPKMTFAFGSAWLGHDLGGLVDLEQADVGRAR